MANTYWHEHPRGFSNECNVLRAETVEEADSLRKMGLQRLTVVELRNHINWINAENESWGSNNAFGKISLKAICQDPAYSARRII